MLKEEALVREITVAEIEQANMVMDPLGAAPNLPFGHLNAVCKEGRVERFMTAGWRR